MDQLKILMEHRFWVLSALAVLLPPIGWWVSTGDMAHETEIQTKKINTKIKSMDDLTQKAKSTANKEWIDGAQKVNAQLETLVDDTQKTLYQHQQPAMVFWRTIRKPLEEAKVKYHSDNAANPKRFLDARRLFISRYDEMWRDEVFKVVEPFDVLNGDGKVWCRNSNGQIPIMKAPVSAWQQRQMISADEMWAAQEDLWMLHALMKAVARVNEGSSSIDDARIKRLLSVKLRGGSPVELADRRNKKKSNGAPGGAPGGGAPAGGFGGLGGMMGIGRSEVNQGPKSLPLIEGDDIFGSGEDAGAAASAQAMSKKKGPAEPETEARPYVESDSNNRWRARGFVLEVVMDHQEIPKLLTVLTESPFPVQIWQVEHIPFDSSKNQMKVDVNIIGPENEAEQKRVKSNQERVAMAMNQSNLAEVLVAGTFLLYNEPAGAAAPATPGAGGAASASKAAPTGTPAAKGAPAVPASKGGPATAPSSGAKPGTPAPKSSPANTATPSKGTTAGGGSKTKPATSKPGETAPAVPSSTTPKSVQPTKS